MRKKDIEKIVGASSARMEKCLKPDSNRDPPAYAADCSAVELLRLGPTHEPDDILTISLQLQLRHTDTTSAFSASPTGPPQSDPKTRAAKEDIN